MQATLVHGRLKSGAAVVLENNEFFVQLANGEGSFTLPVPMAIAAGIRSGNLYRLELNDGRACDIVVKQCRIGSHEPAVVTFELDRALA